MRGWSGPLKPLRSAAATEYVLVSGEDGTRYSVPVALLTRARAGGYTFAGRFADLVVTAPTAIDTGAAKAGERITGARHDGAVVVPVVAETLVVSKRPVVVGGVRLTKRVRSQRKSIEETVIVERAEVERVSINRMVETAPPIRYEGETMVIPVVEEVLVVEKRLMLREEIRISKRQVEQPIHEQVTVRSEEVTVERFDGTGQKLDRGDE